MTESEVQQIFGANEVMSFIFHIHYTLCTDSTCRCHRIQLLFSTRTPMTTLKWPVSSPIAVDRGQVWQLRIPPRRNQREYLMSMRTTTTMNSRPMFQRLPESLSSQRRPR